MAATPFPKDARVVVDRPRHSPSRCVVLSVDGNTRTVREIDNTNSPAGRAAEVRFRDGKVEHVVDVSQCRKEPRSRASRPAYTEMPDYVQVGAA